MRELFVVTFTVCLVVAKPQYNQPYSYESPNNQQNGFVQQEQSFQQTQSFDASQYFQQQQQRIYQSEQTTIAPYSSSYQTQGSLQSDHSFLLQQQQLYNLTFFNTLAEFSAKPLRIGYSIQSNNVDQTFITNPVATTSNTQLQNTSEDTDGTLDSFKIYSTIVPNPADIAPSLQSTYDSNDSISLEPPYIQPAIAQQPQQQQQLEQHSATSTVTVHKHIYIHAPPKDFEESEQSLPIPTIVNKNKHFNIIFVKTPTISQSAISQHQYQPQSDEKTIIYVLVKKPETEAIQNIQPLKNNESNNPQVYFIKYKAQKEISNTAAQIIQQTHEHNEPIYARSKQPSQTARFTALQGHDILPETQSNEHYSSSSNGVASHGSQETENQYLPPN